MYYVVRVSAVANTEYSSSTLPRSRRSRGGGSQTVVHDHEASASSAALDAASKRRSTSHSYRMQTESSLAKVSSSRDQVPDLLTSRRKESLGASRFQSTPNLVEPDEMVPGRRQADRNWSGLAMDDSSFSSGSGSGRLSANGVDDSVIAGRPKQVDLSRSKTFTGLSLLIEFTDHYCFRYYLLVVICNKYM